MPVCSVLLAAACGSGDSGQPNVPGPDHVLITTAPTTVSDCGTFNVTADRRDESDAIVAGATFSYATTDTAVVTVNAAGGAIAQGPGTAGIVVNSSGATPDTLAVTVNAGGATFTFTVDTLTLAQAAGTPVSVSVHDCHGDAGVGTPTLVSRRPAVASVAALTVTGVSGGTTRIVGTLGASSDSIWVKVSGSYAFVLDTTITGGGRYYSSAVGRQGYAYLTRPDAGKLARLDLLTRSVDLTSVAVGIQVTGVSVDTTGSRAWAASQGSSSVDRVDAIAATGLGTTPLSFNPYWTLPSPDGATVFVSGNGGKIAILDGATGVLIDSAAVNADPFGMAVTPDGATLFVGHLSSTGLVRVNTATRAVSAFKTLGAAANGMAVSPDGATLVVASQNADSVYFLATADGTNTGQVAVGSPWGVAFTPDGSQVWVTTLGGNVVRINTTTHAVTGTIAVGGTPRGISIHPLGWGAVVANENGSLHILR